MLILLILFIIYLFTLLIFSILALSKICLQNKYNFHRFLILIICLWYILRYFHFFP